MRYHHDSRAICNYISDTITELIDPIEEIQWDGWETGDDPADARNLFVIDIWQLAHYLANIDGSIDFTEAALYIDMIRAIDPDHYGDDVDVSTIRDAGRAAVTTTEFLAHAQLPFSVIMLRRYDVCHDTAYADKAVVMFFRVANTLLKADGTVTQTEEAALLAYKDLLYAGLVRDNIDDVGPELDAKTGTERHSEVVEPGPVLDDLVAELNSLIGLATVKAEINQLINFLKVQQLRERSGMASVPITRHLVFYGNPGTGKTTVARMLAQIYRAMGILTKGHLVETDRSGLVAGYVGQTALKVQEVVNRALGGVLFVDEAYSLTGDGQDYGGEAIDTLIKLMEDHRDDLIVIVAGYTDKMSVFIRSNPGMRSRFTKFINFEDYEPCQLVDIFALFCRNAGFHISPAAHVKLEGLFQVLHDTRDSSFGNARLARNLFEQAVSNQANRIVALPDISEAILSTLEVEDVPGEVDIHSNRLMS